MTTNISAWRGGAVGAASGAVVVALMFGVRLVAGIQALPDVAADAMTLVLPGSVFGFLIDRLQEYGRTSLLVGVAVGLIALCGLQGAIAATRLAGLGRLVRGAASAVALSLLTLPVVFLGAGEEAAAPAVATALYWVIFAVLLEIGLSPTAARPLVAKHAPERRVLLLGAGALAALWLSTYLGERLARAASLGGTRPTALATLPPVPATTPMPGATVLPPADAFPGATWITTTSDFYVISKNGIDDPAIDAARWRMQVVGERPYTLGYDELRRLPVYEAPRTLECISNIVGGGLISTALFAGPPLKDLLGRAGLPAGTKEIRFNCADGYTESLPLDAALDPTTIVAHTMNGEPLTKEHGFPARLLLSGRYGIKNPKWLTALLPIAQPYNGYWEQRGWNKDGFVRTFSRLDLPQDGAVVPAGGPYPFIRGVAYAGSRGITKVEISFDGGRTWDVTQLRRVLPTDNWMPFTYVWTPPGPGAYDVVVRAYDGDGSLQDATERDSFPDGATGLHRTSIKVA